MIEVWEVPFYRDAVVRSWNCEVSIFVRRTKLLETMPRWRFVLLCFAGPQGAQRRIVISSIRSSWAPRNLTANIFRLLYNPLTRFANPLGPYFAVEKKGAHNINYIVDPKSSPPETAYGPNFTKHVSNGVVALITLAPELPGGVEVIEKLTSQGIKISMGHTMCKCEDADKAISAGATLGE